MKRSLFSLMSFLVLASASVSGEAMAGSCVLHVTRTACPGKGAESFKKCEGKASCDETSKKATAEACEKEASEKSCVNTRLDVTKLKKVTVDFDGKPLKDGKDFCDKNNYPKFKEQYNQCK